MRAPHLLLPLLLLAGCGPGLEETVRPDAPRPDSTVPDAEARPPDQPAPREQPWVCRESFANNYDHVAQGRAHRCGDSNSYACANGSNEQMGLWNLYESSWLKETSPGFFRVGRCP